MSLACILTGPLHLSVQEQSSAAPAAGQVLVQLGAGGICGSDLHYYQHGRAGAFAIRAPFVPGHEASGVVQAVGEGVSRVQVGQKVAINPAHPCGTCAACRQGRSNLCERMVFLGSAAIFPHIPGFFREEFVMAEGQLTPIDEDVSLGEIACAEPLSVGLHAVHRAGDVLGATVLVTGAGTIGCMCVIAARLAGAARVIASDPSERAQHMALAVGADEVAATVDDSANWSGRVDVAIEAAGHPAALASCLRAVRRGGRIVQVGTLPAEMPFAANDIMTRELSYLGAFRADVEFDWAVQALRTRRADVRPLISAQIPISQSKTAFDLALDRSRSTKVQLIPG
ncbi:L-idonate 5-dehydrogenase [Curvibacter sp. CHRR-16]|uniref:L-idonate 5-dehydrogenase n=1 Tax=Curvibacter sp. CHRR-16 TaxID=2835872 RepID=UPI001BD96D45|nr:L-idonate 5-dehydrogenase [Curvibacter sp. CHRR-16]MBT0570021.1 L-idonate 5-dehydrogenase [Curvibacter sp. CHRR-16]